MLRWSFLAAGSCSALITAMPAMAQTAPPAAPASAATSVGEAAPVGDIIVTARRREEALQDVPISVTAISGNVLQARGVTDLTSLPVPSLSATSNGPNRKALLYSIRGQRSSELQLLTDPAVGTYFAEVVQPRPYGFGSTLFDISSIQVLKGVQGTLFGRNVTGGAVLIEPNAPTSKLEGRLTASIGNLNLRQLEGFVNLPLGEGAALRLTGQRRKRDGYVRDITTGMRLEDDNFTALRGSLRVGSGPFRSTTIIDWLKANENGAAPIGSDHALGLPGTGINDANFFRSCRTRGVLTAIGSQECASLGGLATPVAQQYRDSAARLAAGGPLTVATGRGGRLDPINLAPFSHLRNWGITNKTLFDLAPGITLKNIASYRKIDFSRYSDLDGVPAFLINSVQNTHVKQYSEELQLQGAAADKKLTYTLGAYYFLEKGTDGADPGSQFPELTILGAIAAGAPLNPLTAPASIFLLRDNADARSQTYAGYAAGTYKFTDQLSVAAGIRYTVDKRQATLFPTRGGRCTYDPDGAGPGPALATNACFRTNSLKSNQFTYDLTLQYEPTSALTAYISTRKGFRAGGFSLRAKSDAEFAPFKPEKVQEYEVGLKNRFDVGGGVLETTAAAFYQDYKNVQKGIARLVNGAVITVITNTTAQKNYGGEFEANLALRNGLTLSGYYSYVGAKIKTLGDPSLIGTYVLQGTPHHQAGANLNYRVLSLPPSAGKLSFNANLAWRSRQHLDDRDASADQPAYALVNLSVDLGNIGGSGIGAGLFADNVFDKRYRVGVVSLLDSTGTQTSLFGPPRTYGARLSFSF
ncbi:MAG: TonB-dependent receptor [Sphingomicrobium sp.]